MINLEDWSGYRYTIDYYDDYKAIKMIHEEIKKRKIFGHANEIIDILNKRSDIRDINKKYYFGIGWNK